MTIIKIHLYRSSNQKQQKFLLTFLPQVHNTVRNFLEFAIKALDISANSDDLILQNDGYMLPHCLDGRIIATTQLLTIKVKPAKKATVSHQFWTASHIPEFDQQQEKRNQSQEKRNQVYFENKAIEQENSLEQSSDTPKFSQDGINRDNRKDKSQPVKPVIKTKKSHCNQSTKVPQSTLKQKNKVSLPQQIQPQQDQEEQQVEVKENKSKNKNKKDKNKKHKKKVQSSSQSQKYFTSPSQQSLSQSSQEQLPRVIRSKKQIIKQKIQSKNKSNKNSEVQNSRLQMIATKQSNSQFHKNKLSEDKYNKKQKQPQLVHNNSFEKQQEKPKKNTQKVYDKFVKSSQFVVPQKQTRTVNYSQKRKIIEADDIESSDSSSEQIYPAFANSHKQTTKQNTTKAKTARMVPPALRNKIQPPATVSQKSNQPSSFKSHIQQQWIQITKQILQKINQARNTQSNESQQVQQPYSNKTIFRPNNLIKFKQIQLDEQKFVPKTSQWIQATVQKIQNDGKLILCRVTQLGRDYRERYDIYEYNMVEIQVNKNHLSIQQNKWFNNQKSANQKQASITNISQEQMHNSAVIKALQITAEQTSKHQSQQKNSIQKFICGQVHFYFSDKNYPYDLFMQMHANKHPQKYVPIRLMLNFPKIKKILRDENKLLQYLIDDQKKQARNYQLNAQTRMIRKRVIPSQIQEMSRQVQIIQPAYKQQPNNNLLQ